MSETPKEEPAHKSIANVRKSAAASQKQTDIAVAPIKKSKRELTNLEDKLVSLSSYKLNFFLQKWRFSLLPPKKYGVTQHTSIGFIDTTFTIQSEAYQKIHSFNCFIQSASPQIKIGYLC